jgi:hypothetical protein
MAIRGIEINNGNNLITGGTGVDSLTGGTGNDTISGMAGHRNGCYPTAKINLERFCVVSAITPIVKNCTTLLL